MNATGDKAMSERPDTLTWDPTSLLEPEIVVPAQLDRESVSRRQGEIGLLWAVFLDGITTYCREVTRGALTSLAYREAHQWIFRPDSDALTSFSTLCTIFQVDPRRLRRRLMRLREEPNLDISRLLQQAA